MSLHKSPETPSERLVLHLETNYGVQLDPARYRQLVSEIDEHISAAMARFAGSPGPNLGNTNPGHDVPSSTPTDANAVSPSPGPLMAPLENLNVGLRSQTSGPFFGTGSFTDGA